MKSKYLNWFPLCRKINFWILFLLLLFQSNLPYWITNFIKGDEAIKISHISVASTHLPPIRCKYSIVRWGEWSDWLEVATRRRVVSWGSLDAQHNLAKSQNGNHFKCSPTTLSSGRQLRSPPSQQKHFTLSSKPKVVLVDIVKKIRRYPLNYGWVGKKDVICHAMRGILEEYIRVRFKT